MLTLERMVGKVKSFKTLNHIGIKLTRMIAANEGQSAEYEKIIKYDPALVMRVFKLVNSAFFSLREKVETVSDAVTYIGFDNLRNMVVVEAVKDLFKDGDEDEIFSRKKLWSHCVATGVCAQMISEKVFGENGEDAFLCGLLHDIGIMIEDQLETELFLLMLKSYDGKMSFTEHEKKHIGVNHCEAGFWLSRDWKLPASVQFGIRDHHLNSSRIKPDSITGIIQLSELLVTKLDYSAVPEMHHDLPRPLLLHMRENIKEYKTVIQGLPEEMKKAKDIYAL